MMPFGAAWNDDPTVFATFMGRVDRWREVRIAKCTYGDENHLIFKPLLGMKKVGSADRAEPEGKFRALIAAPDVLRRLT